MYHMLVIKAYSKLFKKNNIIILYIIFENFRKLKTISYMLYNRGDL